MIKSEIVTIRGTQYRRTWSDTHYITRDGVEYLEAIDPIDTDRTYTETETPLPTPTADELLEIILGEVDT